jgi:multiple antibiotic resistance protein
MILATLLSLISVINPLGTVPIFLGLTGSLSSADVRKTALKAALISCLILLVAFYIGTYVLTFFSISIMSLKIAGGIIILLSGYSLLTGKFSAHKGMDKRVKNDAFTKDDPSFTPLAIPMLAGPGSMSFLINLKSQNIGLMDDLKSTLCILLAGLVIAIVLNSSRLILKKIGASGLNSLSRIIGFIVMAIGVEYIASGIRLYLASL